MNKLLLKSPAKINLDLTILNKLKNGYHEINTSFQLIDLFDEIEFETSKNNISLSSNLKELNSDDNQILDNAILESLRNALRVLISVRKKEGTQLSNILEKQISELLELCGKARVIANTNRHQISETLEEQIGLISKMKVTLSEERLEQELALLLTKLDVTEEVDRLSIHLDSCMNLLKSGRTVGRRLDFICQELNREANTLCSKSSDTGLTSIGIDLKVGIEKFREQIQNIQ